jgi:hypothetical protein
VSTVDQSYLNNDGNDYNKAKSKFNISQSELTSQNMNLDLVQLCKAVRLQRTIKKFIQKERAKLSKKDNFQKKSVIII